MSLPIQLISTDFDGTLFAEFENPPIPEELEALIRALQADGAKWVINTGRDMSSLMETLGRSGTTIEPDFLILVEREIYLHHNSQYVGVEEWNAACTRDHARLFDRIRPDLPGLIKWINERFHARVYEDSFSPFCLIAANNSDADIIHEYLNDYCERIGDLAVVRNDIYARFSHIGYNKGTALAELTRRLGLHKDQVFAVGDHLNDLPMLSSEYARFLAAPDNAIPLVKAAVFNQDGYVSPFSQGKGVADALKRCLEMARRSGPKDTA